MALTADCKGSRRANFKLEEYAKMAEKAILVPDNQKKLEKSVLSGGILLDFA